MDFNGMDIDELAQYDQDELKQQVQHYKYVQECAAKELEKVREEYEKAQKAVCIKNMLDKIKSLKHSINYIIQETCNVRHHMHEQGMVFMMWFICVYYACRLCNTCAVSLFSMILIYQIIDSDFIMCFHIYFWHYCFS